MQHDLYQVVTDRIVSAIEAGTVPWVKPWSVTADPRPVNASTQRPYRGINCLLLGLESMANGYMRSRWLTFRQAAALGAHVKKGEHGCTVVFYKLLEVPEAKDQAADQSDKRVVPLLRAFTVFNVEQMEGLPAALLPQPRAQTWDAAAEAEAVVNASGAQVRHGAAEAYYNRRTDAIYLPERGAFADSASYYGTLLHELVHWTGHTQRCNRDFSGRFGDASYAMEELVAELGSAFLCAHCQIDGQLQHAAYVTSWLQVLKSDKKAIFTASAKAQAASDFLLQPPRNEEAYAVNWEAIA